MVGASIYESLRAMTDAAAAVGATVILINPLLQDRQSSSGVMSVRGRSERMAYADSFKEIFHFRLLYSGTTFMFPILGCLRMSCAAAPADQTPLYVLYQRRETGLRIGDGHESYTPVGVFDAEPGSDLITPYIPREVEKLSTTVTATPTPTTTTSG